MTRVIVTCDDCGISNGINQAALDLHRRGLVTTASMITTIPEALDHAVRLFADAPDLEIGVHLVLSEGLPATDISGASALTDAQGRFRPTRAIFARGLRPSAEFLALAEAEFDAQIGALLQHGVSPRQVTTHFHLHLMPALREMIYRLMMRYDIPWLRAFSPVATVTPFLPVMPQQLPVEAPERIVMPDYLVVVAMWMRFSPERLLDRLLKLSGTVEILGHPCRGMDPTFPPELRYPCHKRVQELRYLERFHDLLLEQNADHLQIGRIF